MQHSHKVSNFAQFFLPFDFLKIIFIGVQLIYNVVLVSAVAEQSVIHIHISTLFQILFPYRSLQSTEQSCLCYTVGHYFIYSVVYMCIYVNPNLPIYPSPPFLPW